MSKKTGFHTILTTGQRILGGLTSLLFSVVFVVLCVSQVNAETGLSTDVVKRRSSKQKILATLQASQVALDFLHTCHPGQSYGHLKVDELQEESARCKQIIKLQDDYFGVSGNAYLNTETFLLGPDLYYQGISLRTEPIVITVGTMSSESRKELNAIANTLYEHGIKIEVLRVQARTENNKRYLHESVENNIGTITYQLKIPAVADFKSILDAELSKTNNKNPNGWLSCSPPCKQPDREDEFFRILKVLSLLRPYNHPMVNQHAIVLFSRLLSRALSVDSIPALLYMDPLIAATASLKKCYQGFAPFTGQKINDAVDAYILDGHKDLYSYEIDIDMKVIEKRERDMESTESYKKYAAWDAEIEERFRKKQEEDDERFRKLQEKEDARLEKIRIDKWGAN